jgi:hypothetical protein
MAKGFPGVPVADDLGEFETLLSNAKVQKVLGYKPEYTWR